jgi:small multidrug resistance pump
MKQVEQPSEMTTSLGWLLLGLAVSLETAGAIGLRFSAGFTLMVPTLAALGFFALALFLVSKIMKILPVSIAYPVWAGGGTVGVALVGILVLGEALSLTKAIGIGLVAVGVVIMNVVTEKTGGC